MSLFSPLPPPASLAPGAEVTVYLDPVPQGQRRGTWGRLVGFVGTVEKVTAKRVVVRVRGSGVVKRVSRERVGEVAS